MYVISRVLSGLHRITVPSMAALLLHLVLTLLCILCEQASDSVSLEISIQLSCLDFLAFNMGVTC